MSGGSRTSSGGAEPVAARSGVPAPAAGREGAVRANRWVYRITRYWMPAFSLLFGLYVGLPFLAPVFMALGLELPARAIYAVYSFLCHQLPQRSFFLFGQSFTYPLAEIQAAWHPTDDLMVLRQFTGTPVMGWKVAWSDRMVSMFTSVLLFAWIWYPLRRRFPRIGLAGLLLFLLPMFIDGSTHFISDLAGVGQGFRDSNLWLVGWTGRAFPAAFYAGDAWGSFNSLMRLLTGLLFGAGLVWFAFPYLDEFFEEMKAGLEAKFRRAGIQL